MIRALIVLAVVVHGAVAGDSLIIQPDWVAVDEAWTDFETHQAVPAGRCDIAPRGVRVLHRDGIGRRAGTAASDQSSLASVRVMSGFHPRRTRLLHGWLRRSMT